MLTVLRYRFGAFKNDFINLFSVGRAGSSLLCWLFSSCGAQASRRGGFSYGEQALGCEGFSSGGIWAQ